MRRFRKRPPRQPDGDAGACPRIPRRQRRNVFLESGCLRRTRFTCDACSAKSSASVFFAWSSNPPHNYSNIIPFDPFCSCVCRSPDDNNPPPAPPYILWEQQMVAGSFASSGFFFFCFCGFCAWCGLNGRVRGGGRNKWWGTKEMRIDRPPLGGANDRGYFATQSSIAPSGDFFSSLPLAVQKVKVDPIREGLLEKVSIA